MPNDGGQERQYERGDAEGAKVIRTSQDPGPGLGPGLGPGQGELTDKNSKGSCSGTTLVYLPIYQRHLVAGSSAKDVYISVSPLCIVTM